MSEVDDIMKLTDDEVLAACRAAGGDPEQIASEMRGLFEQTVENMKAVEERAHIWFMEKYGAARESVHVSSVRYVPSEGWVARGYVNWFGHVAAVLLPPGAPDEGWYIGVWHDD